MRTVVALCLALTTLANAAAGIHGLRKASRGMLPYLERCLPTGLSSVSPSSTLSGLYLSPSVSSQKFAFNNYLFRNSQAFGTSSKLPGVTSGNDPLNDKKQSVTTGPQGSDALDAGKLEANPERDQQILDAVRNFLNRPDISIAVKYPKQDALSPGNESATEPESESPVTSTVPHGKAVSQSTPIQLNITLYPTSGIEDPSIAATALNRDRAKRLVKLMLGGYLVGLLSTGVVYSIAYTIMNLVMFRIAFRPIDMGGSVRSRRQLFAAKVAAPLLFWKLLQPNLQSGIWAADDLVSACLNSTALISLMLMATYAPLIVGYQIWPQLSFELIQLQAILLKILNSLRKFIK